MLKFWLLRLHRWLAIAFALPLAAIILSGLVLSFEPLLVQSAIVPGSLSADRLIAALDKADPSGRARGLSIRPYDQTLNVSGAAPRDLRDGSEVARSTPAALVQTSRQLHERLLLDAGSLVIASTVVMLILVGLGVVMGWMPIRNTLSGWHRAAGWFGLPLLIASPLTGLFIAFGVSFNPSPPAPAGPPVPLREAVRLVAAEHDLAGLTFIRPIGGRTMARIVENGEARVYQVTTAGLTPTPRQWPRLLHEGNWGGSIPPLVNVLISLALVSLMVTGVTIWVRRTFRRRNRRAASVRAGVAG